MRIESRKVIKWSHMCAFLPMKKYNLLKWFDTLFMSIRHLITILVSSSSSCIRVSQAAYKHVFTVSVYDLTFLLCQYRDTYMWNLCYFFLLWTKLNLFYCSMMMRSNIWTHMNTQKILLLFNRGDDRESIKIIIINTTQIELKLTGDCFACSQVNCF